MTTTPARPPRSIDFALHYNHWLKIEDDATKISEQKKGILLGESRAVRTMVIRAKVRLGFLVHHNNILGEMCYCTNNLLVPVALNKRNAILQIASTKFVHQPDSCFGTRTVVNRNRSSDAGLDHST